MTPRCALWLLLALAPLACATPLEGADGDAEQDSYVMARDAAAGEDYFPALSEPAEGEYEYETPPRPLPAIVYFAAGPSLAQAPSGPAPLGPSKLANKVSEGPLAPRRSLPAPPPPPARLVPALVLLLPSGGPAPALEPPRFRQLPPLPSDDAGEDDPRSWLYLQPPASREPALPFDNTGAVPEVPEPATEVRPPPLPEIELDAPAPAPATDNASSDESKETDESEESKESTESDAPKTTEAPEATRTRRSPVGAGGGSSSNSKSSASSSSGASGSYSSASSQSSSSNQGEPIYFGGPTNSGSYSSSQSSSSAQSGGVGGVGGAGYGVPSGGFSAPGFGGAYDNYGAGAAYNPQQGPAYGTQGGYGGQGGQGGQGGFGTQTGHGYGGTSGGEGNLLNRFGALDEPGPATVEHSGTSTGKGVHSSASSSIDSTGKVTYHVQAGKF